MKVVDEMECRFPEWAIVAQEYGDYSGLSEEDVETLHNWQRECGETVRKLYSPTARWEIVFTSNVNEFDRFPEFGKPCATNLARLVVFDN